jgi:hypothetical protein
MQFILLLFQFGHTGFIYLLLSPADLIDWQEIILSDYFNRQEI